MPERRSPRSAPNTHRSVPCAAHLPWRPASQEPNTSARPRRTRRPPSPPAGTREGARRLSRAAAASTCRTGARDAGVESGANPQVSFGSAQAGSRAGPAEGRVVRAGLTASGSLAAHACACTPAAKTHTASSTSPGQFCGGPGEVEGSTSGGGDAPARTRSSRAARIESAAVPRNELGRLALMRTRAGQAKWDEMFSSLVQDCIEGVYRTDQEGGSLLVSYNSISPTSSCETASTPTLTAST